MTLELKVTLDASGNAFIRSSDAALIVNKFKEELNSWSKTSNFKNAKLPTYQNDRKNGVWFNLLDCLAYAIEHGTLENEGDHFIPLNGTWSSPDMTRSKLTFINSAKESN